MSANSPCRVCSQENSVDQLVDIFETNCHPGTIAEVITELTGLEVKENDGLPSLCCVQCQSDLTISITIRRKCIYSDNIMRALLQSTFVKPEAHGSVDFDHIKQEGSDVEHLELESDELVQQPEISFEKDNYKHYKLNITPTSAQDINERMVAEDGYKEFGVGKTYISNPAAGNPEDSLNSTREQSVASAEFENNLCSVCKTYFVDFSSLQEHAAKCHNGETSNRNQQDDSARKSAEFCFVSLPGTRLVQVSKKVAVAPEELNHEEVIGCCMCRRIYQSEAELIEHGKLMHAPKSAPASEMKPFQCNICYAWFKTKGNVRTHQMKNRKRKYKCATCGKLFRALTDFVRHKNKHDQALIFPCKYCTKRFVSVYRRLAHEKKCNNREQTQEKMCNAQEQTEETVGTNQEQTPEAICKIPEQSETPVNILHPRYRYPIADNEIIDLNSVNHICCGCGTTFDTEDAMIQHANHVHAKKARLTDTSNPFKCNICYQTFKTEDDLSDHEIKMLPRKYKCATCGAQFRVPCALVRHKARHSKEPVLPCKFCGKLFVSLYQKLKHQQYQHILKRPNNEEQRKEKNGNNQEQTQEAKGNIQQDEHILEKPPKCCGCGSDFGTKNELLQHAQTVHAPKALVDQRKPFRCNICYKSFKTENNLHRHQDAQGPYQCAICGKIFSVRSTLYMHEKVHNTKEFECGQCEQTFHSNYAKMKHIRLTHRAQASHVCPTCGKTYTTASYLRDHMSLHGDKPLHKCYCGAEFKMKHYLYSHMAKEHSGRNTCRFCQATFRCPSVLKGHENGHLGLKEYFCSVCNEGFYSQKQLGKHRAKWHGPKSRIKKRKQANKS